MVFVLHFFCRSIYSMSIPSFRIAALTTEFVLDENTAYVRILGEVRSDGGERLYAYGPEGFTAQQTVGGGVEYPLLDGLGSVRQLIDAGGTVILTRSYDAYGAVRYAAGAGVTRLGYTGEMQDSASGLVYLRARHYHPVLGRFLQRDSFGGFVKQPQSLNRYSYVYNNPLIYIDPSGHYADQVLLTHFGCESWSCVEARFQNRGTHAGLWGWLDVLLRAEDGDEISTYAFYGGTGALLTGRFVTVGGRIMVAGVTMILDFSVCPFAPEISDLWEEETFAKTALMGSWLPGHNAFYKGPYGVSVHDQQYQDCRHHDCVTQALDAASTASAAVAVGCSMVGAAPCATPFAMASVGIGAFSTARTSFIALTTEGSALDVAVAIGLFRAGAKANPNVSLMLNLMQWGWDLATATWEKP